MSLNGNALCTLEELKSHIGIDLTDTSKDIDLTIYINGVCNAVEKMIGRNIMATDYTEKYKGTNSPELILKHYPVNSIADVNYVLDGTIYRTLDDYEYDIDEESGILTNDRGWRLQGYSSYMSDKIDYPRRHIQVQYNAGYTEAPPDLKLVCLQYISDSYVMDNSQGGTFKSYSISDVRMDFKDEIKFSEEQRKVILSYKGMHF